MTEAIRGRADDTAGAHPSGATTPDRPAPVWNPGAAPYRASQRLWEHYLNRLCTLAGRAVWVLPIDEGQQAMAAALLDVLWLALRDGKGPRANDPDCLWSILTGNAAGRCRGGQHLIGQADETAPAVTGRTAGGACWAPTPEPDYVFSGVLARECIRCLELLDGHKHAGFLSSVAWLTLRGIDLGEVAARLQKDPDDIEAALGSIRELWRGPKEAP